jgi:hypothetical protein
MGALLVTDFYFDCYFPARVLAVEAARQWVS